MQSTNPIYEGPMYDTIEGESFKSLASPLSPPSTPSAESANRYVFSTANTVPGVPPQRKGSTGQTPTLVNGQEEKPSLQPSMLPTPNLQLGEDYMVMNTRLFLSKTDTIT